MAGRRHVRPVAGARRWAENPRPARRVAAAGCFFRRRYRFQTARFHVLVSCGRVPADARRVRRQPVCRANPDRAPRPPATPRPAARRCAPYPPRYPNLVRLFYLQRRRRRAAGMVGQARLVGALHRHRFVCFDGRAVCGGVDLPQNRAEGLRPSEKMVKEKAQIE